MPPQWPGEFSEDVELPPAARFALYLGYWALAAAIFLMPEVHCRTQSLGGPESLESVNLEHSFGSVGSSEAPMEMKTPHPLRCWT
eukprot:s40_g41.t1